MSPLSSVIELEYQRARFMFGPRVSVLPLTANRLELLLPVFVVPLPVQLSPPAMKTPLPSGSTVCELQKMSVPLVLSSVRWPPFNPPAGSHTS